MRKQTKITVAEKLYSFLALVFAVFWLGFLIIKPAILATLWPGAGTSGQVYPLLILWLVALLVFGGMLYYLEKRCAMAIFSAVLFALCAVPRVVILQSEHYIPTNDFANYLLYGQCFVQGNFAPAAELIANYYQMPKMGGLLVWNGLLMKVFGSSLLGVQLANVVTTGFICVLLYWILRSVHRQAAWLTALFWILYPSNIISTQIPTNHHGAMLFFLLALLLYQQLLQRKHWWQISLLAMAVGLCFTVSNLIHPSVIIIQLSLLCFTGLAVLYYTSHKKQFFCFENKRVLAALLIFMLTGTMSQQFCMQQLYQHKIITDQQEISILFKLVLGFNTESNGSFSEADYTQIRELPEEEQAAACLTLLKQRLHNPGKALLFMLQKTNDAWFERDGYFYWYNEGALFAYSEQESTLSQAEQQAYWRTVSWIDGAQALDIIVVRLMYWLAVLGLCTNRRFTGGIENVLFFIPLGWTAVIMLTEMQSRYRYPAMPVFFFFAALGLYTLWQWSRKKQDRQGKLKGKAGESLG